MITLEWMCHTQVLTGFSGLFNKKKEKGDMKLGGVCWG